MTSLFRALVAASPLVLSACQCGGDDGGPPVNDDIAVDTDRPVVMSVWVRPPGRRRCFELQDLSLDPAYWKGWPDTTEDRSTVSRNYAMKTTDGPCVYFPLWFGRATKDPYFDGCDDTGEDNCGCTMNDVRDGGLCDGTPLDMEEPPFSCWPWCEPAP